MKTHRALLVTLLTLLLMITASNNAHAQYRVWQAIYDDAEMIVPAYQTITIDVTTAYEQNRINCNMLTGIRPVVVEYDTYGNEIMALRCDLNATVLFGAGSHSFKIHDYPDTWATVAILIEAYAPIPTPTPVTMPTGAPTSVGGGGSGITCGSTPDNPCYVVAATSVGGGGSGGGGGGETTPLPTATTIPIMATAIAQTGSDLPAAPVTGVYSGTTPLMPSYVAENNDNYTASIVGETWSFGCPFNTTVRGIGAKVCINYQYISAIRIIGIDIPLGIIIQAMLVLTVIYIIKKR